MQNILSVSIKHTSTSLNPALLHRLSISSGERVCWPGDTFAPLVQSRQMKLPPFFNTRQISLSPQIWSSNSWMQKEETATSKAPFAKSSFSAFWTKNESVSANPASAAFDWADEILEVFLSTPTPFTLNFSTVWKRKSPLLHPISITVWNSPSSFF